MNLCKFALASLATVLALAGSGFANAEILSPIGGNLGALDPTGVVAPSSASYSGAVTGANASFEDVVTFSVLSIASAGNSVTSSISSGNGFASFATELWDSSGKIMDGSSALLSSAFWISTFSFTPLLSATEYSIHITGTTLADSSFSSYGGSLTVSPVPEPETYAMLLAGLALMGFVARRRSRPSGPA